MNTLTLNQEFGLMRVRFRRTLTVSMALHVALFAWLVASRHAVPEAGPVIEIQWLEQELPQPEPVVAKVEPKPIVEPQPVPARIQPQLTVKEKLARSATPTTSVRDKLDALKPVDIAEKARAALAPSTTDLRRTAQATMAPVVTHQTPANLNRGGAVQQPAVALNRGALATSRTAAVVAETPVGTGGTAAEVARPESGSAAVRHLGGATLEGSVADRRVLSHVMPAYPSWATVQAVEAVVTLHFVVLPSGVVKENVQVLKTAGFQDFDNNARAAIRQWRFAPLAADDGREQWGSITFRYRLND